MILVLLVGSLLLVGPVSSPVDGSLEQSTQSRATPQDQRPPQAAGPPTAQSLARESKVRAPGSPGRGTLPTLPAPESTVGESASVPPPSSSQDETSVAANEPTPVWVLTFAEDFESTLDDAVWHNYWATSGATGELYRPNHVTVSDGVLTIAAFPEYGRYVTGGLAMRQGQTYGKWEVRARVQDGAGISVNALLWPDDGSWPPEVNFLENAQSPRVLNTATVHYGVDDRMLHETVAADLNEWHTWGVEWSPDALRYTMDGSVWATVEDAAVVPQTSMHLALQLDAWRSSSGWHDTIDATTPERVEYEVDWVRVYIAA